MSEFLKKLPDLLHGGIAQISPKCVPLMLSTAAICVFTLAVGQQSAQEKAKEPNGKARQDSKAPLVRLEHDGKDLHSATMSGVKLEMSPTVRAVGDTSFIDLNWKITNIDARSPLVIVKPLIDLETGVSAVVIFAAPKGKDYARYHNLGTPCDRQPFEPGFFNPSKVKIDKKWYLSIAKGENATGTITVGVSELKQALVKVFPGEFEANEPPRLFVRLRHFPSDRGEELELDAWTGVLDLLPTEIPPFDKW